MADVSSATKHFPTAKEGFTATTSGSVSSGATSVALSTVSGYSNGETVVLVIDPTDAVKKQAFTGTVDTSGVQITNVVWTEGTNQSHDAGATVVDYETATHWALYSKGLKVAHNDDGTHKASLVLTTPKVDTINENTSANGVTIDGLNIKDSKLNTNNSVVTANITDSAVTAPKMAGIKLFGSGASLIGSGVDTSTSFLVQAGTATAPTTYTALSFPAAFPNGLLTLILTNGDGNANVGNLVARNESQTGFEVGSTNSGAFRINYLAIGW